MTKSLIANIVGVIFIAIGVLGFLSDPILGVFETDIVHNVIHLGSGLLGLILARQGEGGATLYGKIMTVVYGLVTILGFLQPGGEGTVLGLIHVNMADNFLHLALTAVFFYLGFMSPVVEKRAV